MIEELKDTPNTMVAFRVKGKASRKDFDAVVLPAVSELVKRTDKLNYLLIIDAPEDNDIVASWLIDAMHQLNNHEKWNKAAIVAHVHDTRFPFESLRLTPGAFKTFGHSELKKAIDWVGEQPVAGRTQV